MWRMCDTGSDIPGRTPVIRPVSAGSGPGGPQIGTLSVAHATPPHRPEPRGERIVLDDSFFTGPLAGGVERRFEPIYSYRGMILVSASGEVRTGYSGRGHMTRRVRALDAGRHGPARAYPYR